MPRDEIRARLQVAKAQPCRHDVPLMTLYAFGEEGLVLRLAHQALELRGLADGELGEPAAALRLLVDQARIAFELAIDRGHLARHRRVDLACRLHRFDHRRLIALGECRADRWQLDEDDVAELVLRMLGDAEGRDIALDPHPLMVLGEFEFARGSSCSVFSVGSAGEPMAPALPPPAPACSAR